jgi:hypothetical protein
MSTVATVVSALQAVLGPIADRLGRKTGFIRRQRKLTGSTFVRMLVFGWLENRQASLEQLTQRGVVCGVKIRAQGLAKRLTQSAAACLAAVLGEAVRCVIAAPEGKLAAVLERFAGVWVMDSTRLGLPGALAEWWPGTGGGRGGQKQPAAGMKVEVNWELKSGRLSGPFLQAGRDSDQRGQVVAEEVVPGSLRIADLGYFSIPRLHTWDQQGVYWLSRLRADVEVYDEQRQPFDLMAHVQSLARQGPLQEERGVWLGQGQQCAARLLLQRVPPEVAAERRRKLKAAIHRKKGRLPSQRALALCDWTLLITNVPPEKLTLEEALVLYGVRWQVELLFKLWKQHLGLDTSSSTQPWRILCEIYAKLLIALMQHWLLLLGCWRYPNRSLVKAAHTIAAHATSLAIAFNSTLHLTEMIYQLIDCLSYGCRVNRRKKHPSTYQLLERGTPAWA